MVLVAEALAALANAGTIAAFGATGAIILQFSRFG